MPRLAAAVGRPNMSAKARPTAPARPRRGGLAARMAPTSVVLLLILVFWEFFGQLTGEPAYIVPSFHAILRVAMTQAGQTFLPAAWVTLQEMLAGFALGVLVGVASAFLVFASSIVRRAILPLVIASQAIPVIAIAPVLVIWFGFGIAPKVIVTAIICFFPVMVNTLAGLESVDSDVVRLMRSLGANGWQTFTMARLPAAQPFIFAGLKNAAAISAIGAIVGEWVGAESGLGPVMIAANAGFKTAVVFAAIIYLAIMAIGLFTLVGILQRAVMPWYYLTKDRKE